MMTRGEKEKKCDQHTPKRVGGFFAISIKDDRYIIILCYRGSGNFITSLFIFRYLL